MYNVVARPTASPVRHMRAEKRWNQGRGHASRQQWTRARASFAEAVALCPDDPVFQLNLANACLRLEGWQQAWDAARRVIEIDAMQETAYIILAEASRKLGRSQALLELVDRMPAQVERTLDFDFALGMALIEQDRPSEALSALMKVLRREPAHVESHLQMGVALQKLRLHREAAECFRTVLVLEPTRLVAAQQALHEAMYACDWPAMGRDLLALRDTLERAQARPVGSVASLPFGQLAASDDPHMLLAAARLAAASLACGIEPLPARRQPRKPGRLRIGYFSNDFHHHVTARLMVEMLERHDRSRFEVLLYSFGPDDSSELRRRIVAATDRFVEVQALNDADIARRMHEDGLDVLVDLKGYCGGCRPRVFAHRPAPVQVAFLGFPATTGADCIDYFIGDPVVTPLEHADRFSEHIAQLPGCYQPNDRQRPRPPLATRADCGLPEDAVVFASFNAAYKVTPALFDTWCRILQQVPGSVLWLLASNAQSQRSLLAEAQLRGVDPSRVHFAPVLETVQHLARAPLADLMLDTFPCTGHTTTSDSLWAGLPVLTLCGQTFAARVAASLLHAVGLPELVCQSLSDYERLAIELGHDVARRERLRAHLDQGRMAHRLFDSERYTREMEALFERMVERHAAGLAPAPLAAQD